MSYKDHPLLCLSDSYHKLRQPSSDMSFNFGNALVEPTFFKRLKLIIGFYIYPLKNRIQRVKTLRRVKNVSKKMPKLMPDSISFGHKGYAQEIFLAKIKKIMDGRIETIIVFGCGTGEEVINVVKYLKPSKIIAIDYFNYQKIWKIISKKVESKYNIDVEFMQLDFDRLNTTFLASADLIYSHTVLEHLRDMDNIFLMLKKYLKPKGYFAAQWGPMWYSFSGDHIAAELGIEKGFEHLLLNPTDYTQFYLNHPRNKKSVDAGILTWLELGLHNFATYEEYISSMTYYFGQIKYLHWVVSPDALLFAEKFRDKWNRVLEVNTHISGFDLSVQCAGALLQKQ